MPKVIDLTSLLFRVKQEVSSSTGRDRYEWLRVQAIIETMMAEGKQKLVINGAEKPKQRRVAVRVV